MFVLFDKVQCKSEPNHQKNARMLQLCPRMNHVYQTSRCENDLSVSVELPPSYHEVCGVVKPIYVETKSEHLASITLFLAIIG